MAAMGGKREFVSIASLLRIEVIPCWGSQIELVQACFVIAQLLGENKYVLDVLCTTYIVEGFIWGCFNRSIGLLTSLTPLDVLFASY